MGLSLLIGCGTEPKEVHDALPHPPDPLEQPVAVDMLPGVPIGDGLTLAPPTVLAGLQVFPIYGADTEDLGPVMALPQAVKAGHVAVREVSAWTGGAEVHQLSFDNVGEAPVFGLGGSVFEGGFQDRMIVQDVVIEPGKKQRLYVNCTEQHRWTPLRLGVDTQAKFGVMDTLAGSELRATGEIFREQQLIWSRVAQTNAAHCVSTPTDALAATLDDPKRKQQRGALATKLRGYLDGLAMRDAVVGLAYMVDGAIREVRMFATPDLFRQFEPQLTETAAFDAIALGKRSQTLAQQAEPDESSAQGRVIAFVKNIRERAHSSDDKAMGDVTRTHYLYGDDGYASIAMWKRGEREVPIAASFLAKPRAKDAPRPERCSID